MFCLLWLVKDKELRNQEDIGIKKKKNWIKNKTPQKNQKGNRFLRPLIQRKVERMLKRRA